MFAFLHTKSLLKGANIFLLDWIPFQNGNKTILAAFNLPRKCIHAFIRNKNGVFIVIQQYKQGIPYIFTVNKICQYLHQPHLMRNIRFFHSQQPVSESKPKPLTLYISSDELLETGSSLTVEALSKFSS